MSRADTFSPISHESYVLHSNNYEAFSSAWEEADELRKTGELLRECGHTPWYESQAKEKFFEMLENELTEP